ncbi:hypothetical protein TRFO_29603 [Tritrichomonas foetus]|uniref:Uncharacterized protein n=1 Tax=Tritrichomonas foetus TaxID=1144522 RepID=A0A1J4JWK1_9EUKA|nr:hypothetical protein TRFO_29603 [Tritrichomonas foetus]|eukprot:OHT03050.1 hypothetical protein TRFO_29603 [Tritrichomonas foetus]
MSARTSLGTSSKTKRVQPVIDTSKYDGLTLIELRQRREKEVNDLNFEEVAVIDEAIKNYNVDNTAKVVEKVEQSLATDIDSAFARFDQACQEIENRTNENEQRIRTNTNSNFQIVKERHVQELADLETERQLDVIRSKERPSAKNNEMKNIAKNLARSGVIDAAITTREEAKISLEQELAFREYDINLRYEKILGHCVKRQSLELETMQNNFQKLIQNNENAKNKDILLQRQTLKGYITNAMRRAITEGCNELSRKDKRPELSQQITDFVQQKLVNDDRVSVFQGLD